MDAESLSNDVVLTGLCDRGNSDPITPLDLDIIVEDYTTTLFQVLDRHATLKTKTVRARPKVPWYTSEIAEAKGDTGKQNGDGEEHDHRKICWHSRNSRTTLLI